MDLTHLATGAAGPLDDGDVEAAGGQQHRRA